MNSRCGYGPGSLFDEFRYGTDPDNPDTDGDGVSDRDEVTPRAISGYSLSAAGGDDGAISNPTDPSDRGDPANCVTVRLTVGDPSGSNSERWTMEIRENVLAARAFNHRDVAFGTPGSKNYPLTKGKTYVFRLKWGATDPDYDAEPSPDFDWRCLINDSMAEGARPALHGTGVIIVEDNDSLLTWETHGDDENITIGKEGKIHVPKVASIEATCPYAGKTPVTFEGGKTDFGDPTVADDSGKALIIFRDQVATPGDNIDDFDITLVANILPQNLPSDYLASINWTKVAG